MVVGLGVALGILALCTPLPFSWPLAREEKV